MGLGVTRKATTRLDLGDFAFGAPCSKVGGTKPRLRSGLKRPSANRERLVVMRTQAMRLPGHPPYVLAAGLLAAALAGPAWSGVTVLGGGEMSARCSSAASQPGRDAAAIPVCSLAIASDAVVGHDLAGLYVNRGVLELRETQVAPAHTDFDMAISIDPALGEAWVDRGAALIAERRWRDGVDDIDRGLALGSSEPEKAYFNRALAEENLNDIRAAYLDYVKAQSLAPAWQAPREELTRFTVRSPNR